MKRKHKRTDAIPRNARQAETRERALAVLALSRRGKITLREASQIEGIRPSTVLRYAGSGFEKHGKDYRAKKSDRIPRTLVGLDSKGKRGVTVLTPRAASQMSQWWNAVKKYQRTGDYSALKKFRGKRVPYGGFNFVVSLAKLNKFADAGILEFEKLYWSGKTR
jgi:hypothetical protein